MEQNRMIHRILLLTLGLAVLSGTIVRAEWKPVPGHIMTEWADDVDPENPLPEYPRPQFVRNNWVNLNGITTGIV